MNDSRLDEEDEQSVRLHSDSNLDVSLSSVQVNSEQKPPVSRFRRGTIAVDHCEASYSSFFAAASSIGGYRGRKSKSKQRPPVVGAGSSSEREDQQLEESNEEPKAEGVADSSTGDAACCGHERACCGEKTDDELEAEDGSDPWQLRKNVRVNKRRSAPAIRLPLHSKTCVTCGHPEGVDYDLVPWTALMNSPYWNRQGTLMGRSSGSFSSAAATAAAAAAAAAATATINRKDAHSNCTHCVKLSTAESADQLLTSTPKVDQCFDGYDATNGDTMRPAAKRQSSLCERYSNLAFERTASLNSLHGQTSADAAAVIGASEANTVEVDYRYRGRWRRRHSSLDHLSVFDNVENDAVRPRRSSCCVESQPPDSPVAAGAADGDASSDAGSSSSEVFRRNSADAGLIGILRGAVVHVTAAIKDRGGHGNGGHGGHHGGTMTPCRSLLASTSSESSIDSELTVSSANSSSSAVVACCNPAMVRCGIGAVGDLRFGLLGGCSDRRHQQHPNRRHNHHHHQQHHSGLTGFIARQHRRVDIIRSGGDVTADSRTVAGSGHGSGGIGGHGGGGGFSPVDAVRRGLTNLLRTGGSEQHLGSSVVGQRMAAAQHNGGRCFTGSGAAGAVEPTDSEMTSAGWKNAAIAAAAAGNRRQAAVEPLASSSTANDVNEVDRKASNSTTVEPTITGQHESWLDAALESLDGEADGQLGLDDEDYIDDDARTCGSRTSTMAIAADLPPDDIISNPPDDVGAVGTSSFYESMLFDALDGGLISSSDSASSSTEDLRADGDDCQCDRRRTTRRRRHHNHRRHVSGGGEGNDDDEHDPCSRSSSMSLSTIAENELLLSIRDRYWQSSLNQRLRDVIAESEAASSGSIRTVPQNFESSAEVRQSPGSSVAQRPPASPAGCRQALATGRVSARSRDGAVAGDRDSPRDLAAQTTQLSIGSRNSSLQGMTLDAVDYR
jgi:hypothetical protein